MPSQKSQLNSLTPAAKRARSQAKFNKMMYRRLKKATGLPTGKPVRIGFPDSMRVKLVYSDINDLLEGSAPTYNASKRFAMTNLVDPDITGTGAQPPLFDNLKALYNRWLVNSCKITVTCENYTQSPVCLTLVGLFDASTNSPTSPSAQASYDLMALPSNERSSRKRLNALQSGSGVVTTLTKVFKPDVFVGQDYWTSVNYAGIGNTAPNNYPVIDLIAQSANPNATSAIGLWVTWRVEYDVTFYESIATEIAAYD